MLDLFSVTFVYHFLHLVILALKHIGNYLIIISHNYSLVLSHIAQKSRNKDASTTTLGFLKTLRVLEYGCICSPVSPHSKGGCIVPTVLKHMHIALYIPPLRLHNHKFSAAHHPSVSPVTLLSKGYFLVDPSRSAHENNSP